MASPVTVEEAVVAAATPAAVAVIRVEAVEEVQAVLLRTAARVPAPVRLRAAREEGIQEAAEEATPDLQAVPRIITPADQAARLRVVAAIPVRLPAVHITAHRADRILARVRRMGVHPGPTPLTMKTTAAVRTWETIPVPATCQP